MASDGAEYTWEANDATLPGDDLWWVIMASIIASNIAGGLFKPSVKLIKLEAIYSYDSLVLLGIKYFLNYVQFWE